MRKFTLLLSTLSFFACSTSEKTDSSPESIVCEIDSVSYSQDVVPVLETHCYECHSEEEYASKADGNLLEGYDALKNKIDKGLVIGNINHEKGFINMPYRKAKIDTCSRLIIMKWVEAGALNN